MRYCFEKLVVFISVILFAVLVSCGDGHTSTDTYESDADGTKVTQTVIHHIDVHRQILDLADVRVEYIDDKGVKYTETVTDTWVSPELKYQVYFGTAREQYGELKLFLTAKTNIDEILEFADYSSFLNDESADYSADATSIHEDGVKGGSWKEGGYTYGYAGKLSNDEIKKYIMEEKPIYRIYMRWFYDKDADKWVWFHSSTFRTIEKDSHK